ncbi:MAG: hypothetical protein Q9221_005337 [Calogaya cf. arnoldii]
MPPNTSSSAPSTIGTSNGGDSPLSTTANILSILTFALGLFASYVALISAQKEINRVAGYIFDDTHYSNPAPALQSQQDQNQGQVNGRGEPKLANSQPEGKKDAIDSVAAIPAPTFIIPGLGIRHGKHPFATNDMLYDEVQGLLRTCVTLFYEADDLLKRSERDPYGLRRRILFVMNRNEVTEKMNRLADQKAKLAAIQMSLFLRYVVEVEIERVDWIDEGESKGQAYHFMNRKSTSQDLMLSRIAAFSETFQNGFDPSRVEQRRQHLSRSASSDGGSG